VAANVLKTSGAGPDAVRRGLAHRSGRDVGRQRATTPQTPRAKKVIEYAIEEAKALDHNYIGTEHILLGLLREEEGVAAQVLLNLGLNCERVRRGAGNAGAPSGPSATLRRRRRGRLCSTAFGRELTDAATAAPDRRTEEALHVLGALLPNLEPRPARCRFAARRDGRCCSGGTADRAGNAPEAGPQPSRRQPQPAALLAGTFESTAERLRVLFVEAFGGDAALPFLGDLHLLFEQHSGRGCQPCSAAICSATSRKTAAGRDNIGRVRPPGRGRC
jgi:hypothetical protein